METTMHAIQLMVNGEIRRMQAPEGSLLSEILAEAGFAVSAPCGGRGKCGKCRVRAEGHLLPPPDANGLCLACQTRITGPAMLWPREEEALQSIEAAGSLPEFILDPMEGEYGLAVDIGTTTLAAQLVSLKDGALLQAVTGENPQRSIAHDVIGRIQASMEGRGELLQRLIRDEIRRMTQILCQRAGISAGEIAQRVYTGNTAMLYLLTGRDPKSLAAAPFAADCLFGMEEQGAYLPPCFGAYVGADIACALLSSELMRRHQTAMLIDIGTNGEICLLHDGKLYCCATAAGPAFEGVGISCGVSSIRGAIESVWTQDGKIFVSTIGNAGPAGLCGSGLIDAAAALLELEWMDETGYIEDDSVEIAPGIRLTRKDIRMMQLAKGSICAGVLTLMDLAGINADDVQALYIAGGFGRHINIDSAMRIGLIPEFKRDRVHVIGNAALAGAVMLLLNKPARDEARRITQSAECINLAGMPAFTDFFTECMLFPET